jgi:hypothetical protein
MLYYSKGIIDELINKKVQFDSKISDSQECSSNQISSTKTNPYILKVTEFYELDHEYYAVHLSDGTKTLVAIVDIDQYYEQTSSITTDKSLSLQANCSIILNEICITKKSNYNEKIHTKLPKDDTPTYFTLSKATVIGILDVSTATKSKSQSVKIQSDNENKINVEELSKRHVTELDTLDQDNSQNENQVSEANSDTIGFVKRSM